MKINKAKLQQALEIVKPGLDNTEMMEQSTSFAFLGDRVVTYNDSISLSHPVEHLDLEGAIRAEELYGLLKNLDEEEIQLGISENQIKIKAGRTKAELRLEQEIKLPIQEVKDIPTKEWQDLPEEFASDLDFVKDSTSNDMSRRILTCVSVEKNRLLASDSFQIMRAYLPEDQPFPFPGTLIPSENISEILKVAPTEVALTSGWIHFRNLNGTQLSCRILEDSYPDTEGHFDIEGQQVTFPKEMTKILDRVMVFTKQDHVTDEEMKVMLKDNKLMVKGENEYGKIKEVAPVKYEGNKASFWITPHLLQNILKRSNSCLLGSEKIKFEGQGWEYVAVLRAD